MDYTSESVEKGGKLVSTFLSYAAKKSSNLWSLFSVLISSFPQCVVNFFSTTFRIMYNCIYVIVVVLLKDDI